MLRTHLRPSRTTHAVVAGLIALAAFGAVDAHARSARPRAGSDLVSMRRYDGQIVQNISVQPDGRGEVGLFIGEATGIRYHAFRLTPKLMQHLRLLVSESARLRREVYIHTSTSADPFVVDTQYVVLIGPRSLVTDSSPAPRPLEQLTAELSSLIDRYAHAVSDSRPTDSRHTPGE